MKNSSVLLLLCLFALAVNLHAQTPSDSTHTECWEQQPEATLIDERGDSLFTPIDTVADLRQRLLAISQEADETPFNTGICIYDLTADSLLFQYNAHKVMRPASCQKILTAVTALDRLGSSYALTTRAYYEGSLQLDTIRNEAGDSIVGIRHYLEGDILIKAAFDPAFSYADLRDLATAIQNLGIDSIAGRLRTDLSIYSGERLGNGWCWDDVPSDVVPYLTPLLFNHELPLHSGSKFVNRPEDYFISTLQQELQILGIHLSNKSVTSDHTHLNTQHEIFSRSRTVEQLLGRMMKKSDNLYAEALFIRLGGAKYVEALANKLGFDSHTVSVADGSGLSLYNYCTPASIVAFLRHAAQQPKLFSTLYHSLPIAGEDGTLSHRMNHGAAHRNVHAKTGTVNGVSSLSGYLTTVNGHLLAFSIISNGTLRSSQARHLQDRICQALAE